MFQLIHVLMHIELNGSIQIGSQATIERTIGEIGHNIHSRQKPFANMANNICQMEQIRLLSLYYPALGIDLDSKSLAVSQSGPGFKLIQEEKFSSSDLKPGQQIFNHLQMIEISLGRPLDINNLSISLWGKLRLSNHDVLQSQTYKTKGSPRVYRWFKVNIILN